MNESAHDFGAAMMRLHQEASSIGYSASYFLRMLHELGGVATARKLINSDVPADGFIKLWELGRLDLTVEALAAQSQYRELFTRDEVLRARKRLDDYKR